MMHLQMNHFDRNLSRVEIKHESLRFSYIESPEFGQWNGTENCFANTKVHK